MPNRALIQQDNGSICIMEGTRAIILVSSMSVSYMTASEIPFLINLWCSNLHLGLIICLSSVVFIVYLVNLIAIVGLFLFPTSLRPLLLKLPDVLHIVKSSAGPPVICKGILHSACKFMGITNLFNWLFVRLFLISYLICFQVFMWHSRRSVT